MADANGNTGTCADCGCEGAVCATVDGEILSGDRLVTHPALAANPATEILVAGRMDGSELHKTFCDACAVVRS